MRNITMTALALCAMATTGAMAADATTPSLGGCASMASQVRTAIETNQSSANIADATKEKNFGRDFCNNSMYKAGMDHYAQALKLLGASAS